MWLARANELWSVGDFIVRSVLNHCSIVYRGSLLPSRIPRDIATNFSAFHLILFRAPRRHGPHFNFADHITSIRPRSNHTHASSLQGTQCVLKRNTRHHPRSDEANRAMCIHVCSVCTCDAINFGVDNSSVKNVTQPPFIFADCENLGCSAESNYAESQLPNLGCSAESMYAES